METVLAMLAGGVLLGFAGSLHCACMCGGIASGALFLIDPRSQKQRIVQLLLLQTGRITSYAIAGGCVASLASLVIDPNTTATSFRALQWLGAAAMVWIGLATAGMLPRLALPGPGAVSIASTFDAVLAPVRRHPTLGPLGLGLTWGLTPCPMVYAALLSAALAGSFGMGVLWMAAFGVGTLPGVIGAALGISALSRIRKGPAADLIAGLAIVAFGFSTLYFGWPVSGLVCATR